MGRMISLELIYMINNIICSSLRKCWNLVMRDKVLKELKKEQYIKLPLN